MKANFSKFINKTPNIKISGELSYHPKFLFDPKYQYEIDFDVKLSNGKNLQRGYVWTDEQKESFILSLFKGIHFPPLYAVHFKNNNGNTSIFKIIDGKQRLSTIKDFMEDKFPVISNEGEEYLYSQLDEETQRKVWNADLRFHLYHEYEDTRLTDEQLVDWFDHLNFSGTKQDINHIVELRKSL